jgi:hypothetical protein
MHISMPQPIHWIKQTWPVIVMADADTFPTIFLVVQLQGGCIGRQYHSVRGTISWDLFESTISSFFLK